MTMKQQRVNVQENNRTNTGKNAGILFFLRKFGKIKNSYVRHFYFII